MKGFKKVYNLVKYNYDVNNVDEQEVDSFIKQMDNKGYHLQDSYYLSEGSTEKELVFTK